ncbi:MAG: M48 family metallopeptidase [Candidatus Caenarcaniphilales bacterium]|nr:M48 family metallopeptidase [Candidatus Caenarcaniphilales bacterium]
MQNKSSFISIFAFLICISVSIGAWAGIFSLTQNQEIQIGRQAAAQINKTTPLLNDRDVNDYIDKIGRRLVRSSNRSDIPYTFRVANLSEINAFALPGGFIYINRGLIQKSTTENELVGVMGHEIGHVVARHSVEQIERSRKAQVGFLLFGALLEGSGVRGGSTLFNGAQLVTQGVFLKFSRDAEREADRIGAKMVYDAGWNPNGMVTFFKKLEKEGGSGANFFSTHPSPAERQANISDLISQWKNKGITDSDEFQSIRKRLATLPPSPKGTARR